VFLDVIDMQTLIRPGRQREWWASEKAMEACDYLKADEVPHSEKLLEALGSLLIEPPFVSAYETFRVKRLLFRHGYGCHLRQTERAHSISVIRQRTTLEESLQVWSRNLGIPTSAS
jgi:hypothetical protein